MISISKQSIYNKIKLKEYKDKEVKKQGKTYIEEDLLNLIKDSLKLNTDFKEDLKHKDIQEPQERDIPAVKDDILNMNKELIKALLEQLKEKDLQIYALHKIVENSQVLIKEKPQRDILQLEEHFQGLEIKLMDIKEQMIQRKDQEQNIKYEGEGKKNWFRKILKNKVLVLNRFLYKIKGFLNLKAPYMLNF